MTGVQTCALPIYYTLAWGVLLASFILVTAGSLGFELFGLYGAAVVKASVAFELITLSIGLADRINLLKEEGYRSREDRKSGGEGKGGGLGVGGGAGGRQIECTINGIGERAGNCSLEEVVMALDTRADAYGIGTRIDTTRLYPTSRLVASITGMHVPRNKATVGENAFAPDAGIHQHGMLKDASTYEIMKPEHVGISHSNLVLGKGIAKHSRNCQDACDG